MDKTTGIARLGAVFYVLWGLLHYTAAYNVFELAYNIQASMEQGRLLQLSFYLLSFATAGIVVAVTLNWRNDWFGFWLNGIAIGIADVPFILFVLLPGYMPWWPGVLGPAFWIAALICTAFGQWSQLAGVSRVAPAKTER
jgi:hypothetical protein